jgi:hypothetical protein
MARSLLGALKRARASNYSNRRIVILEIATIRHSFLVRQSAEGDARRRRRRLVETPASGTIFPLSNDHSAL